MAAKEKHLEKADNNAAFAQTLALDKQVNIDWALTASFYSALHYVEAYLEKNGILPHLHDTHGKRDRMVALDATLRRVHNEYIDLKNFSLAARYQCLPTKATAVKDDALPALNTIQQHLRKKI